MRRGFLLIVLGAVLALVPAGARAATVNPATYSYLTGPTDELGVPGYQAGSELTPSGSLYTGYRELAFAVGPGLTPVAHAARTLLSGRYPVFLYHLRSGPVTYGVTVFAEAVHGVPTDFVRVNLHNTAATTARAGWGTGLLYSGGYAIAGDNGYAYRYAPLVPFSGTCRYTVGGGSVLTQDTVPALAETYGATPAGFTLVTQPGAGGPVTRATQCGLLNTTGTLAPGASATLTFAFPITAPPATSVAAEAIRQATVSHELGADLQYWRALYAEAPQIQLPESKVTNSFYASLAWIAMSRFPAPAGEPGWIQTPNKLTYNAFFIRDAAFIARALDVAGLHTAAEQDLDYFSAVQGGDGDFVSQPDQLDGWGEALWAIGQHAQWPGNGAYARAVLPSLERAVSWFVSARASDPLGLIPVSDVTDNELTDGHITGDDFLAADGLSEAIQVAEMDGRPDLVTTWKLILGQFENNLHAALGAAEKLTGGWIPPALEDNGGQNWGNLWAAYPLAVTLAPSAPAVTATLAHVEAGFREGIATYGPSLHDYLAYRVFETDLERGDQPATVAGLYAELAHTTATDGGFELGIGRGGARVLQEDMAPHGWFAAEYVTLLRNMLVQESGGGVELMAAVSPDWLAPGDTIAVSHADTVDGPVSFTLHSVRGGATLSWHAALRQGATLWWELPAAAGARSVSLNPQGGTLTVHWHLRGAVPSFAATAAALLATG